MQTNVCKDSANERNANLFAITQRVQPIFANIFLQR